MRLARLPQENARMQGAERRRWLRRHSPAHLEAVERLVLRTLRARGPQNPARTVVLGAGACTELPLARLAAASDEVLLVDVDIPGMLHARDELPADRRGRVNVVQADLTGGVSASLAAELARQPWADLAALGGHVGNAPLDAVAGCLERCPVADPPRIAELAPHGYGVVISSLVLTQLYSLPLLDIVDALSVYAPGAVDRRELHARYREAALRFRRRIALAHLALLRELLAPDGAALLITDVTGYLVPARGGPHGGNAREALPVLPPEVLRLPEDLAAQGWHGEPPLTWQWVASLPDATRPGRTYDVTGIVLRRASAT
jgi:hypothetical protein